MKSIDLAAIAFCLVGFGCQHSGSVSNPLAKEAQQPPSSGHLSLTLQKREYRWTQDDLAGTRMIQAALQNLSDATYYSNLGDGFNSSLDQENLYVGEGTNGVLEWQNPDGSWSVMSGGHLIEGTRFIALRSKQSYRLLASLYSWRGDETGQFRFRVEYFDRFDPAPETQPLVDYSPTFTISK